MKPVKNAEHRPKPGDEIRHRRWRSLEDEFYIIAKVEDREIGGLFYPHITLEEPVVTYTIRDWNEWEWRP
ncbi:MAG: hypothetical protein ABID54_10440 [Pseudomonadota bacterium]